jgi:hypothetical protein
MPVKDQSTEAPSPPGAEAGTGLAPAWEDEDDEGVVVDLAGRNRLRKLRRAPDEDTVTGKDYEERLRGR